MAGQGTEHEGAHDVVRAAAAVAGVVERAFAEELFPPPASLEELKEEDELSFAGDGCLVIPLGVETSALECPAAKFPRVIAGWFSTHPVGDSGSRQEMLRCDLKYGICGDLA